MRQAVMSGPAPATPGLVARMGRGFARVAARARDLIPGRQYGFSLTSPVLSGIVVTPESALTFTAAFAAINVISTDVAKLPLTLNRERPSGGRVRQKKDARDRLVSVRPNPEMNAFRYRQMQMGHVLGWGNHYSEIVRDGEGMPTALWPLHPGTIKPTRDTPGKALYYKDSTTGKAYRPEDVLHIAGLGFDGIAGYSPIIMARQAVGLGIAAEQFGASMFGNGARPGGILRTPKKLSDQAAKRLRETWENVHQGTAQAHRTAVLEDGLEWQEAQISPEAAQFLATRQFQVLEVARIFALPPHKLGDYSQSHLANVEESNLDYLTSTLQGWLESIEAEYDSKLLFDDEQGRLFLSHDMTALMRGNSTARGGFYKTLFTVGAISPNEIRASEGMNPSKEPNADKAYLQAQFVPIEDAGEAMAAKSGDSGEPKPDPEDPNGNETTEKPARKRRFNPNHGKDGKFGAGHGGSGAGGGAGHGMSDDEMIARSDEIGEKLADHAHPVPEVVKETGVTPEDGWESDASGQHREMVKDQHEFIKETDADQKAEAKEFDRDQVAERKEFLRDQKAEAKERKRDGEDAETIASDHASALADFDAELKDARDSFTDTQREHRESVLSNQRDERKELISGFALELFESGQGDEG